VKGWSNLTHVTLRLTDLMYSIAHYSSSLPKKVLKKLVTPFQKCVTSCFTPVQTALGAAATLPAWSCYATLKVPLLITLHTLNRIDFLVICVALLKSNQSSPPPIQLDVAGRWWLQKADQMSKTVLQKLESKFVTSRNLVWTRIN